LAEILATVYRIIPFLSVYVSGNIGILHQAVVLPLSRQYFIYEQRETAAGQMHRSLLRT
jgi:hypothetical protein